MKKCKLISKSNNSNLFIEAKKMMLDLPLKLYEVLNKTLNDKNYISQLFNINILDIKHLAPSSKKIRYQQIAQDKT